MISVNNYRKGYSAVSHGVETGRSGRVGSKNPTVRKPEEMAMMKEESGASSAWAPDPVTGYYRPENRAMEIGAAELREMLLNQKVK